MGHLPGLASPPRRRPANVCGDCADPSCFQHLPSGTRKLSRWCADTCAQAKLVFLPSPNNPTGTILPNAVAETILQEDTILVSDEAYADFCDVTALDLFQKYDNLIVCRTFSKWAGLAGLRLGYGIAHADLISVMMGIKQPYNVNTAAEIAGLAALKHRDEILVTVNALRAEKDRMWTRINEELSWLKPVPSDANFVLNEVVGGA